jgi:hypothetical protein
VKAFALIAVLLAGCSVYVPEEGPDAGELQACLCLSLTSDGGTTSGPVYCCPSGCIDGAGICGGDR